MPSLTPAPPLHLAEFDSILARLEALLFEKTEEGERRTANAKFGRLESLLVAQQEARIEKDNATKKVAATEAKRKGDEAKLFKLEKPILAQKDKQSKKQAVSLYGLNKKSKA